MRSRRLLLAALLMATPSLLACNLIAGLSDHHLGELDAGGDAGPSEPIGPTDPTVLIGDQATPRALVVADARLVFWVNDDERTIYRIDLTDPERKRQLVATEEKRDIDVLTLDTDNLYWGASTWATGGCSNDHNHIGRVPKDGQVPDGGLTDGGLPYLRVQSSGCLPIADLVVTSDMIYWATRFDDSGIARMSKAATDPPIGTSEELDLVGASQHDVQGMWVDKDDIYWSDAKLNRIVRVDRNAFSGPQQVTVGDTPSGIVGTDSHLFWISNQKRVKRQPKGSDDTAEDITDEQTTLTSIATDGVHVYLTDSGAGAVLRVPVGGGELEVIATAQNDPKRVFVDANNVYWTASAGGEVLWMKKPR